MMLEALVSAQGKMKLTEKHCVLETYIAILITLDINFTDAPPGVDVTC